MRLVMRTINSMTCRRKSTLYNIRISDFASRCLIKMSKGLKRSLRFHFILVAGSKVILLTKVSRSWYCTTVITVPMHCSRHINLGVVLTHTSNMILAQKYSAELPSKSPITANNNILPMKTSIRAYHFRRTNILIIVQLKSIRIFPLNS